jgi:glyoxylase-like metal-dependent hydrolase (beta-lactamase superfamily II)
MTDKRYRHISITPNFYQLGIPAFPAYLSLGDDGMIIEGGTGATFTIIINQLKELGIEPERIKYLFLTHTHADHIGAIPRLRKIWPHLKVVASPVGEKLLTRLVTKEGALKEFITTDRDIAEIRLSKGEVDAVPAELDNYIFGVDMVVKEGDRLDLGSGVSWTVYDTPGHSPCHISLHNEKEGTLHIGDATGFYVPGKDIFWPNYFNSLEAYCDSIRKLASLPAQRGALCHNGVIEDGVKRHLQKALRATESYHREMIARLDRGEDLDEIALDKAKWVVTFTTLIPFEGIRALCTLLIRRSQSAVVSEDLFAIPQ